MKGDTILLIGASSESLFAISEAQKQGLKVVAFDGNKDAPGLKYADFSFVCDIKEPKNIINIVSTHGFKPICVLPVPIGRYLITTGAINDHYNFRGGGKRVLGGFKQCDICTDKLAFHKALNANGGGVI